MPSSALPSSSFELLCASVCLGEIRVRSATRKPENCSICLLRVQSGVTGIGQGWGMAATDDELVVRAVRGDREALSALLDRCGDQIARRLGGEIGQQWRSVLDVEDVMQVTFVEAFLQIGTFTGSDERSFAAWLGRIAENNLRDAIRALQCEKRPQPNKRAQSPAGQDSRLTLIERVAGSTTTVSRKAGRHEANDLLEAALKKLPTDYEIVLRLYDLDGLSGPQVAERMGRRRGAVHMLRSRALVRLAELMGSASKFFTHKS